jgi:outer membrane lipoprotein LolB
MQARVSSFRYLLLLAIAWLAGCALQPPVTIRGEADPALQAQLAGVERWQLDGKLAVRTPQQSESARVQWAQDGDSFDIRLSGPAGLKATRIYGMPGGVRFEQGERRESAGSAEALSERLIGWPLPAAGLTYWLRGLPARDVPPQAASYTEQGWLAELEQAGWQLHFSQHQPVGNVVLPGRIEAARGDVRITVIIKQWTLP